MKRIWTALTCMLLVVVTSAALAQAAQDVPREHWAYEAVSDLAAKGLIKGYPPSGDFFGERTVTRYEMAVIIQRVLGRVDELLAAKADKSAIRPPADPAPEELAAMRRLLQEFRTELVVIGTDLTKVKGQIVDLEKRVDEARRSAELARRAAEQAGTDAAAAKKTADAAAADAKSAKEGVTATKSELKSLSDDYKAHRIGGYIQGRFEAFDAGETSLFAKSGGGGTGQSPTTGGPAVGGPYYGFGVRRARLKLSGPVSKRTGYQLQIDAGSVGPVSMQDAYIEVRDFLGKGVHGRFGQFTPPFGQELFVSSQVRDSPERAFGFGSGASDYPLFKTTQSSTGGTVTPGSVLPLFLNQNRDTGAYFTWAAPGKSGTKVTLGVINGDGRASGGVRNMNNGVDALARVETTLFDGKLGLGLSGYYGTLALRTGPPAGAPPAPVGFTNAFRELLGADIRWTSPWKTQFRAEYVGGLFESTPDRSQYLQGNHAQAWYVAARHPMSKRTELAVKYDEYMPITQVGKTAGGLGRMELIRKTLSGGILYQLDEATRLRLWYAKGLTPYDPSAASGPMRTRLGLITGEIMVSY